MNKWITEIDVIQRLNGNVQKAFDCAHILTQKQITSWIQAIETITFEVNKAFIEYNRKKYEN